jgi:hypothetical protein
MIKNVWRAIILLTIFCLIFFSKWSDYKNEVEFYKKDINISIKKIVEGRGTKVYYSEKNFFYLSTYKGSKFEVGDSISKKKHKIELYTNGALTGFGQIRKPKENYFEYFFGW